MKTKDGREVNIVLIGVMVTVVGLLTVLQASPTHILLGMMLGIVVLVVFGKKRALENKSAAGTRPEVDTSQPYIADVSRQVLDLIKEGRKIEAIKSLRESTGVGLSEAKNKVDEISYRLRRGQEVQCPPGRN